MKFTSMVNSFKSGLISKRLSRRQDIKGLADSCVELTNFYVTPEGAAKRTFGGEILSFVPTNTRAIYSYHLSAEYSFLVCVCDAGTNADNTLMSYEARTTPFTGNSSTYIRIFTIHGIELKVSPMLISIGYCDVSHELFNKSSLVSPYANLPYNLQTIQYGNKLIFVDPAGNKTPFVLEYIEQTSSSYFKLYPWAFDSTLYTRVPSAPNSYISLGTTTTPFSYGYERDMNAQITTSSANGTVGTLVATSSPTHKLKTIVIKDSSGTGSFDPQLVLGTVCLIKDKDTSPYCEIPLLIVAYVGSVSNDHTFYAYASLNIGVLTTGLYTISLSDWGGKRGFPRTVTTYMDRVVFGGTKTAPNKIWAAAFNAVDPFAWQIMLKYVLFQDRGTTDFSGFLLYNATVLDGVAIHEELASGDTPSIAWMQGKKNLHMGTDLGEFQLIPTNGLFTYNTINIQKVSTFHSARVQPVEGDQKIIYVSNYAKEIRHISTNSKDYESVDTPIGIQYNLLSNINELEWLEKAKLAFILTASGLYTMALSEQSEIGAFSKIDLSGLGWGIPESICRLRNSYYIATTYPIEEKESLIVLIGTGFSSAIAIRIPFDSQDIPCSINTYPSLPSMAPSHLYINGYTVVTPPSNSFTYTNALYADNIVTVAFYEELDGLIGELAYVDFLADSLGNIAIDLPTRYTSTDIAVGIQIPASLTTTPIQVGSRFGESGSIVKRIDRIVAHLTNSKSFKVGSTSGTMYQQTLTEIKDVDHLVELSNDSDVIADVKIQSVGTDPLSVACISYRGVGYEGE